VFENASRLSNDYRCGRKHRRLINTWARKPIPNCDVNAAYAADARLADDKYCPWP